MPRNPLARDAWLYKPKAQSALQEVVKAAKGNIEAASDQTARFLDFDPRESRIINWGTSKGDGRVTVAKQGAPEPPESKQLKDPFTSYYVQGIALEPPLPPDRLLNLTEENPLHGACLMAKAYDACGRGWGFEPREGKEDDTDLEESEVPEQLKMALEDLTPELTVDELLYQVAWEMDGIGWGAWEVVRSFKKSVTSGTYAPIGAIYPIPSHTIRATLDPRKWVQIRAGRVRYFKKFGAQCEIDADLGTLIDWKAKDAKVRISQMSPDSVASEIIIFKHYTPRSIWYGVPRWVAGIATIAELTAIREFNVSWFASGGQTDYHTHIKSESMETSKAIVEQVKQQMEENAGRGHITLFTAGSTESDVEVHKLGELLREGHFRFRRGDLAKEVLIVHNVPPYRIGWAETGQLAGSPAEQMLGAYKFGAIKPIQKIIESRLRQTLFNPDLGGIKTDDFWFKLAELNMDDMKQEMTIVERSVDRGVMTPNQGRKRMGMDPDDDHPELDEYYYHGQPLGKSPMGGGGFEIDPETGEPMIDPETGQPIPKKPQPPFGQRPPVPGEEGQNTEGEQKVVDKVLNVISAFESTLRNALAAGDKEGDEKPEDVTSIIISPKRRKKKRDDVVSPGDK